MFKDTLVARAYKATPIAVLEAETMMSPMEEQHDQQQTKA